MKNKLLLLIILVVVLIGVIGYFVFTSNQPDNQNNQKIISRDVVDCEDNYDCLYEQISKGNSAKVVISEKIESLSLEEKSEVKIEPYNNRFKVLMTVLELKKLEKEKPMVRLVVGSVSKDCPQIVNNLSRVESTSASCVVSSAEEAKTLAIEGLSDSAINKYSCTGNLVDEIKRICVSPDFSDFPPGIRKPAVYLYPLQKSKIRVAIDLNGVITKSEPNYHNGWEVVAEPDGLINGKYDYLFYEARLNKLQLPEEGWVVEYKDLKKWFDINLKRLGLNAKEISQFQDYWLNELSSAKYYEIRVLEDDFLRENMNLVIDPKPATVIRRNFYFKPHESKIDIEEPNITTPERKGFTVVEWGGILDK